MVLPPGEYNGMIPVPLPIHSESFIIRAFNEMLLSYAAPGVWRHLITKTQADQIDIHTKESHPYHLYMHTRYALCKCHICSRPSHCVRPQGSTVQNIFQFHSTAYFPIHNLLPPPRDQLPITRLRAASNFPRIPTRTKKYQSFLSYALAHYQT